MLSSRSNYTKKSFLDEFFKLLTPWLIKRGEFIDWQRILKSQEKRKNFFYDLENYRNLDRNSLVIAIKDTILSLDNPSQFIKDLFLILWNTRDFFVSDIDNIIYRDFIKEIKSWNQDKAYQLAEAIVEVWIWNVISRENYIDYFIWLLVWFESDKRKNKWWKEFISFVRPVLEKIVQNFPELELVEEFTIKYQWDQTTQDKTVDFAILKDSKCLIWIEVNFYTNSGSKPTEIKRSYGDVNRQLNKLWIELAWITDGFGYNKMKKSLWDAWEIHPNTYNYWMLVRDFEADLKRFISFVN